LVGLLVAFPLSVAGAQLKTADTSSAGIASFHVCLGTGVYAWGLNDPQTNVSFGFDLAFPTWQRLWVLINLGSCLREEKIIVGQLGLGARYDISVARMISAYPRAGAGFTFIFGIPVSYFDLGCGMSFRTGGKVGFFLEGGVLLEDHHTYGRSEWQRLGTYLRVGVLLL
jgi:hypothetical protein